MNKSPSLELLKAEAEGSRSRVRSMPFYGTYALDSLIRFC